MARATLDLFKKSIGQHTFEVKAYQAIEFHDQVFTDAGLDISYWGLDSDFDIHEGKERLYVNTALPASNVMGDLSTGDGLTVVHF